MAVSNSVYSHVSIIQCISNVLDTFLTSIAIYNSACIDQYDVFQMYFMFKPLEQLILINYNKIQVY